jgi:hypothetical protein
MLCKLMQLCEMMGLQDLNLLVDLDVIRKRPDYQTFADLVEKQSTQCSVKWNGMASESQVVTLLHQKKQQSCWRQQS